MKAFIRNISLAVFGIAASVGLVFAQAAPTGTVSGGLNPSFVSAGTSQVTGIATGDVGAAQAANQGQVFFGSNGSQKIDFGISAASKYTIGGGSINILNSNDGGLAMLNGAHLTNKLGSGTIPAVSTCGSGTIAATASDMAGDVTATGATACTVTFGVAFANKPVCTATDETTAAGLKIAYTGATAITVSGLTSGDEFTYVCIGK